MLTLLIFLLVLSVLVFVHEFGHFITAKRAGLRVDEFGFGFPPRLFGFRKVDGRWSMVRGHPKDLEVRAGGTIYSINVLPFGGFVKIKGESGEDAQESDSFASRGALTRTWIIVAGVVMNALLAVVLIAIGYTAGFPQVIDQKLSQYARVSDEHIQVLGVLPNSPAERAGIAAGSYVIAGNGKTLEHAEDLKTFIAEFLAKPVRITVEREGVQREVELTPVILEQTKKPGIGISLADTGTVRYPLWLAVPKALELTYELTKTIVVSFALLIRDAVMGRPVTGELAGPVGIAVLTGEAARQGLVYLLQFMAILSLNLAVLNILPFPALDGGRILFILIEKVLRRPVARKIEGLIHGAGFALLITFVLFVTYRDLGKYGGRMVEFFKGLL